MKNFVKIVTVFALAISMVGLSFAQKKAVNSAVKSISSSKLDQGVLDIEQAILDPETMSLSSTWVVRGDVYTAVASNPFFAKKYEGAADKAFESYKKASEMDPSEKMKITISLKLPRLSEVYYDMGSTSFKEGTFKNATLFFEKSFEVSQMMGVADSASMFNIALCAANDNQLEKAATNYKSLVDGAYPMMGIYNGLADVYVRMNRKDEALKLMDLLIERFAGDSTAYVTAVGITLNLGDNARAEVILNKAIAKWPASPFLYLAMGVAYENSGKGDLAEKSYQKALEINPDYAEAVYNLGAFYVNKGIKIKTEAENLPLEATDEYAKLLEKANDLFARSIPYLEQIVTAQPKNLDALNTLRGIYVQLKQMDKANKIKEQIDALAPIETPATAPAKAE